MNKEEKIKIDRLILDDKNANKGTEYGRQLLEKSIRDLGFGRAILLDKENRVIAGNKTLKTASDIGFDNVRIVETSGDEVIAVKRTDLSLDDKKARELAVADNRVSEVDLSWDTDTLKELSEQFDISLDDWGMEHLIQNIDDVDIDEFLSDINTEKHNTNTENFSITIVFEKDVEEKQDEIKQIISDALKDFVYKIE